jgi:cAMP-dependent protein kinase regulator
MGSNSPRGGAHHLKNVFAPPLEDPGSFQAPVFQKAQEEKQFIREALQNNFVFAALSERELRTIIDAFEAQNASPNESIIRQGDVGDYFYVIRKGTVRFEVHGNVVGHAGEGKSFGELALLYTSPRAASVIAETKSTLYRVDQKTFRYIMQSQTLQTENDKKDLLKGVSFFDVLDPTDINKLVHTMIPRVFEAGECIVKKGEEGDTFYVIQEGKVRVTDITIGSTNFEEQQLGPGDYFGERALVHKEPRSANVIGKTKGIALSIDRETFEKVVGSIALLTIKAEDKRKLVSLCKLKKLISLHSK